MPQEYRHLGSEALNFSRSLQTFQREVLPPSSELNTKYRRHVHPKIGKLHDVTFHKTVFLIVTSNIFKAYFMYAKKSYYITDVPVF